MQRTFMMRLLPVAGALVLAFGLVSSVDAATASARAVAVTSAPEAGPKASIALATERPADERPAEGSTMARICRRVAQAPEAVPTSLVERCRTWLAHNEGGSPHPFAACRRVLASEHPDASMVERCREVLDNSQRERPERERRERERPERRGVSRLAVAVGRLN